MKYDLIVLGSGPAGLAAAIAARGRNKTALVIGNRWQDSPLARAEKIDNYLGLPGCTGYELLEHFQRHAVSAGVEFVTGRAISMMQWDGFAVTVGSEVYQGGALVMAPGVVRQAKFPGEAEYLGRGVSYCATCDGMLYRGRSVAVVGRTNDAPEEARYLKSIGCDVTYTAPKRPDGLDGDIPRGADRHRRGAGRERGPLQLRVHPARVRRTDRSAACAGAGRQLYQGRPHDGHQRPRRVRRG